MGSTIVVANRKGGSGKTTSTINIANGLALEGQKVLVVDADSQAQATISCGILPYHLDMSIYELLHIIRSERKVKEFIDNTIIRGKKLFDIIPSKPDLSALDIEAADEPYRHSMLKDLLLEVASEYDYIIIDLPPSLGLITVNGLVAGDWLIIPVEPTFLSMDGLAQMTGILYKVNAELNPGLRLLGVLPVKCDLRTNLAKKVIEEIRHNFGDDKLLPPVRNDIKLAESPSFGKSIFEYALNCRGAWDYLQVIAAIKSRCGELNGK